MKKLRVKKETIILGLILALSLFFRTYQPLLRFNFDHDSDLFSWVVKDIVVNHHFRLIGQLTSAPGIFIGPLFYYLVALFIMLTKMDPWGAVIPVAILGVVTTYSYYFVFKKLFDKYTGLIGAFLQAVLLSSVSFDRRVVPSTPTNLWVIWFFYVVVSLSRGKYNVFPILGILVGLIWHIHIALLPLLVAVPFALFIARKLPTWRSMLMFVLTLCLTSLPLLIFEIKHHFMQTTSLINNFSVNYGGGTGIDKLNLVLLHIARNILKLFVSPWSLPFIDHRIIILAMTIFLSIVVYKRIFSRKDFLPLAVWIIGVIGFYTFSSSLISEYYFSNIEVIFLAAVSLTLVTVARKSSWGKFLVIGILGLILLRNFSFYLQEKVYQKGYLPRKAAAAFITHDAQEKGFPCVAVSYITNPGENVGFRYFFWMNNLHVNQVQNGGPIYTIVIPAELVKDREEVKFNNIGVLPPNKVESKEEMKKSCSGQNPNLTDPLFGYTQ